MKPETAQYKRTVEFSSINESTAARIWSWGDRTSRTDAAMVGVLSIDTVDAVFEEESLNFVECAAQLHETVVVPTSATIVDSLASQLAVLESQCVNLRRMLEMAATSA